MLRLNLHHIPLEIPIICEVKRLLEDRRLRWMELTWDEDEPRDIYPDLLASELKKVPNKECDANNFFLDTGTKGIVVYDGAGAAITRMVMNPRWNGLNCKTLGFVASLIHVSDGKDANDITMVLMKNAEAFRG